MSEWQPIETAPKDEEIIMVNERGWLRIGYLPRRETMTWVCDDWDDITGKQIYPTHWMPAPELPAPPASGT